jgi:hypothetical protein
MNSAQCGNPHEEKSARLLAAFAAKCCPVSAGARVPIVATIILLIFAPGGLGERKPAKTKVDHLRCVRGEAIPSSPRARNLGVAGETCRRLIVRTRIAKRR